MPTILLADDSITIQKIVNLTFSGEGIEVVTVGNGETAVKKIHEIRPALVLADIFMPGKNGYEVCDYIKNDPSLSATPVILLVGAFEPFDSNEAARVKADGHLTKPFEIKVLISAVNSLISAAGEPRDALEPAVEVPVSEAADSAEDVVSRFSPLPEMPTTSQAVDIEVPVELPSAEATPVEVAAPIALGVDAQDAELLAPTVSEPVEEVVLATAPEVDVQAAVQPPEPEISAPSLMIEDSDPLGLLDGGLGTGGEREIALDARSMVVDIWEPRATVEAIAPAASEEPAVPVQEMETEIPTAEPLVQEAEDVPAPVPIFQSALKGPLFEPPVSQIVKTSETEAPVAQVASEPIPVHTVVSEELIERIANRVVEKLSREVIERIAWEVVPDLAELMIKEHVEVQLKASQTR